MDGSARKLQRLRLSSEFGLVRRVGQSFTGRWIILGVLRQSNPDSTDGPRFGVVTSRKVGGAVVRNRVRRRLRQIHFAHRLDIAKGFWCVSVARFRASLATYEELNDEWIRLAVRAGVLKK